MIGGQIMSSFKVGMTADHVLLIESNRRTNRVAKNKILDITKLGLKIAWYLVDCTLILARSEVEGAYIVQEILPAKKAYRTITHEKAALTAQDIANWRKEHKK
jgi:hypothetical protein